MYNCYIIYKYKKYAKLIYERCNISKICEHYFEERSINIFTIQDINIVINY